MNVTDREYGRLKKLSSQWSGKISKLHLSHPVFLSLLPNGMASEPQRFDSPDAYKRSGAVICYAPAGPG